MTLLRKYVDLRDGSLWFAAALAACAAVVATVPIAVIAIALYRALRDTTSRPELAFASVALAVAIGLRIVAASAAGRRVRSWLTRRAERLRVDAIERLRLVPAQHLASVDPGRTVAIVTTGLDEAIGILGDAFDAMFGGALTAVLILGLLALVDWRIALVPLGFLPLTAGYLWQSRGISSRATPRLVRARLEGTSRFFEYVDSVALLRAFGRTAERARRLAWALRELQIKAFETSIASIPFGTIALFFIEFGFAITVMIATGLGAQTGFAATRYLIALIVALCYFQTLFDAVDGYLRLRDARSNLLELERLLELATAAVPEGALLPSGHELVIDRVSFLYDRGHVLRDISYRFPETGVTAIVGRSGAGKSALAGLIAGLWPPSTGTVFVGGVDLGTLPHDVRAKLVTLVFQDTSLREETIWKNIAAGRPEATDDEIRLAARTAQCDDFVARLPERYETRLRSGGTNLSLGERQRVAIARALLGDAPIMIFDECTASLDAVAERSMHRAIESLAHRKTVVLITHRLGTIRNAQQIIVLANDAPPEIGTHDSLVGRKAEYWKLWSAYERARLWHPAN